MRLMEPPEILESRQEKPQTEEVARPPSLFARLRRDYALIALVAAAVLINLALAVFLLVRYSSLPDLLPLHFDATGLPDQFEPKDRILVMPVIGLIVFGANTLLGALTYRFERAASVLLAGSSVFVQILAWFATVNIVNG